LYTKIKREKKKNVNYLKKYKRLKYRIKTFRYRSVFLKLGSPGEVDDSPAVNCGCLKPTLVWMPDA